MTKSIFFIPAMILGVSVLALGTVATTLARRTVAVPSAAVPEMAPANVDVPASPPGIGISSIDSNALPEDEALDEPPPAVDMDKTRLDDLVKKDAAQYGDKSKGGPLKPVVVPADAMNAADLAKAIDDQVNAKLAKAKIPASPRADDAEFLRRVTLDLTGTIPTLDKARAFIASPSPDKREKLIDELLASHEHAAHFARYWHELILKRDLETNRTLPAQDVFVKWMTGRLHRNEPWDATVRTMLTGAGDQALAGETFFVMANATDGQPAPAKIVGTAAALFLGNQLQCAECHVHPFVGEWSQNDFWGLAAFFGRTSAERQNPSKLQNQNLARVVDNATPNRRNAIMGGTLPDGSIPIPDPRNEGQFIGATKARIFESASVASKSEITRDTAARWFTSPENPYFARATVNRFWAVLFGRGLQNPLDDFRPEVAASHPELLDTLAAEFLAAKCDVKHLLKAICRSDAYQRTGKPVDGNREDDSHFSRMAMKTLPPRVLFEAYSVATGGAIKAPKDGAPDKRGEVTFGLSFFDTREYDESPTEYTYGVPQLLRIMNRQLPPACDTVAKRLGKSSSTPLVDEIYLTALSRHPSADEAAKMTAFIKKHADTNKGTSAALWVLLNSAEFLNNR